MGACTFIQGGREEGREERVECFSMYFVEHLSIYMHRYIYTYTHIHTYAPPFNAKQVKDIALPILERYTARTNGSSVRLRDPGIAWSYYSTDPEWGLMQAKSVILELEEALAAHDVKVVHLKGMVEIVPKRLSKGVVLRYAIQSKQGPSPDFIMCMGDDASDEYMFTSIYSYLSETAETELTRSHKAHDAAAAAAAAGRPPALGVLQRRPSQEAEEEVTKYVFTCSVGKHRSHASFYVHNVEEVRGLLQGLASV